MSNNKEACGDQDDKDEKTASSGVKTASAAPVAASNLGTELLIDGGFEQAKVTDGTWTHQKTVGGWTSDSEVEVWGKGFYGLKASEGSKFAELDYDTKQSNIYQTVHTEAGAEYTFSFDYAKRPDSKSGSDTVNVFWNGKLVGTVDPKSSDWSKASFKVVGTGGDDKIEFRESGDDNDSYGGLLDNASMKKTGASTAEKVAAETSAKDAKDKADKDAAEKAAAEKDANEKASAKNNSDDDKHDGRGHGDGDHNDDGHDDNGQGPVKKAAKEAADKAAAELAAKEAADKAAAELAAKEAADKAAAELAAKEAADKAAAELAAKEAADKAAAELAAKEAADKAAAELAAKEAADKAAAELAAKEAADKAAAELAAKEAADKAAAELAAKEAADKAAAELAAKEAADKAAAELAAKEAADKAAAELAAKEAADKAAAELAAKEAADKAAAELAAKEAADKAAAELAAKEAADKAAADKLAADLAHAQDNLALHVVDVAKGVTSDVLVGGKDHDALQGGVGNDTIVGNNGDDSLIGDQAGRVTVALDIGVTLVDDNKSESLSLLVSDVPKGAALSAGTQNKDGTWSLTVDDLKGLTITADDGDNFRLHVVATAIDVTGEVMTQAGDINVVLDNGNNDLVVGGKGNDNLVGGIGNDVLYGGSVPTGGPSHAPTDADNDVLHGGDGNDIIYGNSGNDILHGDAGNDFLSGGKGNDVLVGGDGNDVIEGNSGDDLIAGDAGDDHIFGGSGFDTLDYSFAAQGMVVDLGAHTAVGYGNDTVDGIERVYGSMHDDVLIGDSHDNVLAGQWGDDIIRGGKGNDILTGGGGLGGDTFAWTKSDVYNTKAKVGWVDHVTDFQPGDKLDLAGFFKDGTDVANLVTATDGKDGTTISVKFAGGFHDVVVLDGIHGVTANDLMKDGLLLVA